MRLVENVRFRNFRSLRTSAMSDLDEYVPIVGLNGSGKSNILRALNLFFNDEVDVGSPLDMKRDHFERGTPLGGKREILVTIDFDLSSGYEPRAEVGRLFESLGVTDHVTVERAWRYLDPSARSVVSEIRVGESDGDLREPDEHQRSDAQVFVRSVNFRYMANHLQPAAVLSQELQTLRRALVKRFRGRTTFRKGLRDLQKVAAGMLSELSEEVSRSAPELGALSLDIPTEFAELAFKLGLSTTSASGVRQPPELQGSGTQSFLLIHVLDLLDQAMFEVGFGWTKGVLWAIEEPESYLHSGLRAQVAEDLARFSQDKRRQVLVTTHEDDFVRQAETAWVVELAGNATAVVRQPARDALFETSRSGITGFTHPLQHHVHRPLLLVEGRIDAAYLKSAVQSLGLKPRWSLASVPELDPLQGGGDNLQRYLSTNRAVVQARPLPSPVLVLVDWEVSDGKVSELQRALSVHESSGVLRCPTVYANPDLGPKFRGIERYLPTDFVEENLSDVVSPATLRTAYPLKIDKSDLDSAKSKLQRTFLDEGRSSPFLDALAQWIDKEVEARIQGVPSELFLPLY